MDKRFVLAAFGILALSAIVGAPDAKAAPPPYACFDAANQGSPLCAGVRFYYPPGYSVDQPDTQYPWQWRTPLDPNR